MTELGGHSVELLDDCPWVLAVVRTSGKCDAAEFIRHLEKRYQARYRRYFEYLRDGKPIKSPENFRTLQRESDGAVVVELKVDKYRLYLVHDEPYWWATHGRDKPKDHAVGAEIDKALAAYRDAATK
ncbi:hypothetical protein [Arthrobacter sp. STN4]|uniref:hypothetical protein n=1 Tax=Arthrobacter sp. STN4 TaxID=2923276 RepID=UPI00211A94DD|nr:hypothetical protein [Arthrobacter sp. STN4]MCQ9162777.1 hypothetical protein [Arthrobacter sp. STN4]